MLNRAGSFMRINTALQQQRRVFSDLAMIVEGLGIAGTAICASTASLALGIKRENKLLWRQRVECAKGDRPLSVKIDILEESLNRGDRKSTYELIASVGPNQKLDLGCEGSRVLKRALTESCMSGNHDLTFLILSKATKPCNCLSSVLSSRYGSDFLEERSKGRG